MTNENAALANGDARPVESWENREVGGEALLCKSVFSEKMKKVSKLRKRQEAYEASLPTDPIAAFEEIRETLSDISDLDSKKYAPRAALEILHQLATHGAFDCDENNRYAIYWLVSQGLNGLNAIEAANNKATKIAYKFSPYHKPYEA